MVNIAVIANVTNPNTCGILGLLANGQAFARTMLNNLIAMQASIMNAANSLLSLPNVLIGIGLGAVQALANQLLAMANGAINTMIGHVMGHMTNMVNRLTMAVAQSSAAAGLKSSGCTLPSAPPVSTNPCGSMEGLFGSVMGLGTALIDRAMASLGDVSGAISGAISGALQDAAAVMNQITGAVTSIANQAAQMANMVAAEAAALAKMFSDMILFSTASALQNLLGNPCAQSVLGSMASAALLKQLGMALGGSGSNRNASWDPPPPARPAPVSDFKVAQPPTVDTAVPGVVVPTIGNPPTSTSVSFEWTNPTEGSAPFAYQVDYRIVATENWTKFGVPVAITGITVDGLVPNTAYEFRLTTTNALGNSVSPIITAATATVVTGVPAQPTAFAAGEITANQIAFSWTAPATGDQPITYQIRYRSVGQFNWTDFGTPIAETTVAINGLSTSSNYEFHVEAINSLGKTRSAVISASTLGIDLQPITDATPTPIPMQASSAQAANSASSDPQIEIPFIPIIQQSPGDDIKVIAIRRTIDLIQIIWTPPIGTLPFRFQPQFKPTSEALWQNLLVNDDGSATASHLDENVSYDFRVIVSNDLGNSVSDALVVTTLPLIPETGTTSGTQVSRSGPTFHLPEAGTVPLGRQVRISPLMIDSLSDRITLKVSCTNGSLNLDLEDDVGFFEQKEIIYTGSASDLNLAFESLQYCGLIAGVDVLVVTVSDATSTSSLMMPITVVDYGLPVGDRPIFD